MIKFYEYPQGNGVRVVIGHSTDTGMVVRSEVHIDEKISHRNAWVPFLKLEIFRGKPMVMDSTTFSNRIDFDTLQTLAHAQYLAFNDLGQTFSESDFANAGWKECKNVN